MKRIFSLLAALCVAVFTSATVASAQNVAAHFGIQGGASVTKYDKGRSMGDGGFPSWHAGLTCLVKLPAYFAIQPSVLYENQRSKATAEVGMETTASEIRTHVVSVPISLQWGPDLGICRIFVQAVPYFDFNLGGKYMQNSSWTDAKDFLNPAQFGLGAGLGIDIWRLQLSARYNWAFGEWTKGENPFKAMDPSKQGILVSLSYFIK